MKSNFLIYGLGLSGISALKALVLKKYNVFVTSDGDKETWGSDPELAQYVDSKNLLSIKDAESVLGDIEALILSPGISREKNLVKLCLKKGIKVWSEIELAFQLLRPNVPIVAITGTNGKTTTTTLLGKIIKESGKNVFVGGNIGVPFCNAVIEQSHYDIILLELSSFQLESMNEFHVNIALILNISMNHGERYTSFEDYQKAKWNIVNNMNSEDRLFIHHSVMQPDDLNLSVTPEKFSFRQDSEEIEKIFDYDKIQIPGIHNIENIWMAYKISKILNIDDEIIQKTVYAFKGIEHRIERVSSYLEFEIYNDSKSTNWKSTIVAINSFEGKCLDLIVGGQLRGEGESPKEYLEIIRENCRRVFAFGESADFIKKELDGEIEVIFCKNLEEVKNKFMKFDFPEVLLFSPAFPSFDQFKNYIERGSAFKKLFSS